MGRYILTTLGETMVDDRDTYDITRRSYPVMLGLDAMELTEPIASDSLEPSRTTSRTRIARPTRLILPAVRVLHPSDDHRFPQASRLAAAEHNLVAR